MDNAADIAPFGEVGLWVDDISECHLEVEIEPYYYGFEANQKFLVELNAKNLITNETTLLDQIYLYLHEDNVDIDYAYYSLGAGEWNITSSLYVINNDDSLSLLDIEWEDIELDDDLCFDNFTLYDWDFEVSDDYLYIDDLEFFYYNMPKSTFTLEVEFSNSSMAQNTTMILKEYSIEDIGGVIISDTDYTYFPIPKELNGEYNVTFNFYLNEVLITSELHEDEELDGESIYLDDFDIDRIEGMDKLILERSMGIDSETDNWDLYGLEWELYTYEAGELEVELLMINSTLGNITHTQSFDLAEKSFSFVDDNFPVIFLIENSDQYELQFSLKFNGDVFNTETMNKVKEKNIDTNDHQASLNEYDWDYWVEEYYLYGGSYSNTYGEDRLTSIYLGIDLEGYFYTPTMFEYHANFWYKNEAADNYVLTEISSYSMLIQPGFFSDEQGGEYYDYLSPLYEGDYLIEVSATVGNQTLFHKVFSWFTYGNAPEVKGYHDIAIDTRYEDRFDYYFYSETYGDDYTPHNAEYVVDIYKKDLSGEYLIYDKIYHTALSYGYQEYEGKYYFDAAGFTSYIYI